MDIAPVKHIPFNTSSFFVKPMIQKTIVTPLLTAHPHISNIQKGGTSAASNIMLATNKTNPIIIAANKKTFEKVFSALFCSTTCFVTSAITFSLCGLIAPQDGHILWELSIFVPQI